MIHVKDNVWKPDTGFKYISNGEIFAKEVHLRVADDIANWHDTNDEPPAPEDEATEQDYIEALGKLGVKTDEA